MSAAKFVPRDVSHWIQKLRQALFFGRPYQTALRYEGQGIAKRSQPQPNLPPGCADRIYQNYYLTRDSRRAYKLDENIFLASGKEQQAAKQIKDK